ncbi:hypothetical protein FJZ26_04430 [Candidatus Parvarchaeota archaeon]|nr:hypothetical protein [Candidatus Parvarchaeota archaeon]
MHFHKNPPSPKSALDTKPSNVRAEFLEKFRRLKRFIEEHQDGTDFAPNGEFYRICRVDNAASHLSGVVEERHKITDGKISALNGAFRAARKASKNGHGIFLFSQVDSSEIVIVSFEH